ncbi:effector-associated domain 2-containing protein [Micromonospora sp. LOL_021]|uniref:VMAP-C domain-containing protein n=1 Tax=Micromonospora sp. LOL_021 TaxID=3345417 RepID=UPI003A87EB3E
MHDRWRLRGRLVALLEESPTIRSTAGRQLFLQELDTVLGGPPPRREHEVLHLQLVELVKSCAEQPGALRSLAECLESLEPNTRRVAEVYRLVDEWHVTEVFDGHEVWWLREELHRLRGREVLRHLLVAARSPEAPPYCASAWHVLAHLSGLNAVDGMPPWLRFLDAVAPLLPPEAESRLQALAAALADNWGMGAQLTALRTRRSEPSPGPSMAYLVIQFEKYGGDDDSYIVSYWRQWASPVWQPIRGEDQRVERDGLEAAVDRIVLRTESDWADKDGPVTIEFVLPWELLNTPVDAWRKELSSPSPTPLAMDYPVVIRSLDRLYARQWHRLWRSRWRQLTDGSGHPHPVYYAEPDQNDIRLEAILKDEAGIVAMVLNQPPTPRSPGESQALAGLRAGLPILIWHRSQVVDSSLRSLVAALLGVGTSTESELAQLPVRMAQLRRRAWTEDTAHREQHVGHGLSILWDDPDRQPGRIWPPDSAPKEARND